MINLVKGQKIDIGKKKFTVGLGWTPGQGTSQTCDLDCSVFMLNDAKQIPNEKNFVFYGNKVSPDGAVTHSGDDRTGANSAGGDDEQIIIDSSKIDNQVKELLFIVTIHDAVTKQQNFGQVKDCYIRIFDTETGVDIAKFDLNEDFSIDTAIEFGRIYKKEEEWKFDASGIGYREDLEHFVTKYYSGEVTK